MKKILVLLICFYLLAGISTGMASSLVWVPGDYPDERPYYYVDSIFAVFYNHQFSPATSESPDILQGMLEIGLGMSLSDQTITFVDVPRGQITGGNMVSEGGHEWNLGVDWDYLLLGSDDDSTWLLIRYDPDLGHLSDSMILPQIGGKFHFAGDLYGVVCAGIGCEYGGLQNAGVEYFQSVDFNHGVTATWTPTIVPQTPTVPEPGSILLFGSGVIGLCIAARRKLSKK